MMTRKTLKKWQHIDFTKQDILLAKETGLSRERIRQLREEFKQPPSPYHLMRKEHRKQLERSKTIFWP